MKIAILTLAAFAAVCGLPANPNKTGRIIMTFADDGKTPIYEDLDEPAEPGELSVDINNVHFLLYTRSNRAEYQELKVNDPSGLKESNFNDKHPTVVLIHGWQNSHESESVQIVKDSYLQMGDCNVILYDYEKYNSPYLTAVNNAEAVGGCLATFVNYLEFHGVAPKELHLIGHSLGSHIAGYAASQINGEVKRITGLDPAGPFFQSNKPENRLSSDDAKFVDVVHTSNSLGMLESIGTTDFYPHGGHAQPSCAGNPVSDGCDHSASYRYFSETIKNRKLFPARKCKNHDEALVPDPSASLCVESSTFMGEDANLGSHGIFYVDVTPYVIE